MDTQLTVKDVRNELIDDIKEVCTPETAMQIEQHILEIEKDVNVANNPTCAMLLKASLLSFINCRRIARNMEESCKESLDWLLKQNNI